MKVVVNMPREIDIKYLSLKLPVLYDDEDIAYDFPLRKGDMWEAIVDLDTRTIQNWHQGKAETLSMKVCDEGVYFLYDEYMQPIADISENHVPHGVVPGEYGDYVHLEIDESGKILNMPTRLDFSQFFNFGEEE